MKADNRQIFSLLSVVLFFIAWEIGSKVIGADIILPPPGKVVKSLWNIITSKNFLLRTLSTFKRGITGFGISYISATLLAILGGLYSKIRYFMSPLVVVLRSTPVISVILLALIWFNTNNVPIFVSFLMAFPIVYSNILEGIMNVDSKILEMANVYNISITKQIFHIYIPAIIPFILTSASLSLGIIWKAIVAAEVLSQPKWGIGTSLNEAKAFLLTEEVFAWTVVAVLLSSLTEFTLSFIRTRIKWCKYGD